MLQSLLSLQRLLKMDTFLLFYILILGYVLHGTILASLSCKGIEESAQVWQSSSVFL